MYVQLDNADVRKSDCGQEKSRGRKVLEVSPPITCSIVDAEMGKLRGGRRESGGRHNNGIDRPRDRYTVESRINIPQHQK